MKTLGDVLQKTETINPLQSPEAEFDYIDVSSVSNAMFQIEETQRLKGKDAPSRARRLVKTNDVLFATVRPTLQRIAFVPEHLDNQVCSTGYFVLRPKAEIDHRFMFYWLFTEDFMGQMVSLQKGASYPAVTDSEVRAQMIPVPPLSQQQRIVGILDEAFDGIATGKANAEKNLQNARALFESHLQSVFTQRGPGWVDRRLGDIAETQYGLSEPMNEEGKGFKIFRMGEVQGGRLIDTGRMKYADINRVEFDKYKLQLRDVLFNRTNSFELVGKTGIFDLPGDYCFASYLVRVLLNPKIMQPAFLNYFMNSERFQKSVKQKASKSINQANINATILSNEVVRFPESLKEQKIIVTRLDSLREETQHLATLYQRKLAALEELKKSFLHQAFSGRL